MANSTSVAAGVSVSELSVGTDPARRTGRSGLLGVITGSIGAALTQAGEMLELLVEIVVSAIVRPLGYWAGVRATMVEILRACWLPMMLSTLLFGFSIALDGAQGYAALGVPDRLGSFFLATGIREFCPWLNAIVIAGVAGTMLTADLGTRRIRQEFDAMEVMSVDPVRDVLLPQVVAITLMTGLLSVIALVAGLTGGWAAAASIGAAPEAFWVNFWNSASTLDLAASVAKSVLFGLIIGVVCTYKGYRVQEGGPTAVGRAVNNAVVTAFAAVWVTNFLVSTLVLGLNPELAFSR